MKRRDWTVSHGRDVNRVILSETEVTGEVRFWDAAAWTIESLCDIGVMGHGLAEKLPFLWRVPIGKPVWDNSDDEPWLINNLASKIIDFENWVASKPYDFMKEVESIPIAEDTLLKLWPDVEWLVRPDQASWSPDLLDETDSKE